MHHGCLEHPSPSRQHLLWGTCRPSRTRCRKAESHQSRPPIIGFWVRSGAGKGNPRRGRLVWISVRYRRKPRLRYTRLMIEVGTGTGTGSGFNSADGDVLHFLLTCDFKGFTDPTLSHSNGVWCIVLFFVIGLTFGLILYNKRTD